MTGENGQEGFEMERCGFHTVLNPRISQGNWEGDQRWRYLICEGGDRNERNHCCREIRGT